MFLCEFSLNYISIHLILDYHTFAYNPNTIDDRVRFWFPLGWCFESGSKGRLLNTFEIPFLAEEDEEVDKSVPVKRTNIVTETEIEEFSDDSNSINTFRSGKKSL